MGFWVGADDGAERLGEDGEGDVAVPAGVGAALEVVQGEAVLELAVVVLDGLITNDKFCCTRRERLSLSWWRKPLPQRGPVFQAEPVRAEEPYEPDMDCLPPVRFAPRCTAPVGSGVPVTGAPRSRARGRRF